MSFGKQSITVGAAPACDVVLQGPGVMPEHARIVHQGGGQLVFIPTAPGCAAQGRPLAPGEQVPFDLRTPFTIGPIAVPLSHPAITQQILAAGQAPAPPGHVIIGRDPARSSLVLQHGSVSSMHATVMLDRMMVVDHGSTSGTYVGRNKIPPNTPTPLDPNGIVAFGPVPVQVSLLGQIARGGVGAAQGVHQGQPVAHGPAMAGAAAGPPGGYPAAPSPHSGQGGGQALSPGTMAISGGEQMAIAIASAQALQAQQAQQGSQPSGAPAAKKNKTILGQVDFSQKPVKSIGRTPDNDIVIHHPQVSSRHALLHQIGGNFFIEDRGSANGTFVRGQRISAGQKIAVQSGEKIFIGPMPLMIQASGGGGAEVVQEAYSEAQWAGRPLYEIEAWSLRLEVPDRDNPAVMKALLDDVSFKALPGDMIALMGPSGAGKTTLLLTLNGYLPPTGGVVRINGEDLYAIYDTLRGSIGYVPQDDLVHAELTVFEAVRYSARFRLPPDYSDAEIDQRVDQTLKDLGLDGVRNLQIGRPEKKVLSGGQRKRVNIALELVTDPVILFLDEPTSGLAADDTTALIELLANLTKASGKTIIMTIHQPAKDEFEKFTHCLVMGVGGIPMYFGTTKEAYGFFGKANERIGKKNDVDNPRDMFDMLAVRERPIFDQLKMQNPNVPRGEARKLAAIEWRKDFFSDQNPIYRKMYSGRREIGSGAGARGVPPGRAATTGQLRLLVSRYFKVKVRDVSGLLIMLLQAPIIGGLLAVVFGGADDAVPGWCLGAMQQLSSKAQGPAEAGAAVLKDMKTTSDPTAAIFFLVVAAVWFGTSNAAREIVAERAIYLRERMVNLGLLNYVFSKYILLAFFCVVQCTMLLAIVFFALDLQGGAEGFMVMLGGLIATSLVAVALGLLLSTVVTSSEAAMALTPIALIPQVVLGGLIVPSTTVSRLEPVFNFIPARWGFEINIVQERNSLADNPAWNVDLKTNTNSEPDHIKNGKFDCAMAQVASDELSGAWGFTTYETVWLPFAVLGGMAFALMFVLLILLKRRDPV